MRNVRRTEGAPHDRLTRLCDEMSAVLDAKAPDVKAVIMLDDGTRGGIVMVGYDDDADAVADLFVHLKAIFEANGRTLVVVEG